MSVAVLDAITHPTHPPLSISPEMLAAGRAAFLRKRKVLDDLHDYFPCDLDEFLSEIYRDMAQAAP